MLIRKLKENDYQKGLNELLSQLTHSPKGTDENFKSQFKNLKENDLHLVIEIDQKIVAFGAIIIDYKFYREFKNIGHIEDIVVDVGYRGKGLSKLLVNNLIEHGEKQNCYKFILNCKEEYTNFYSKYGFENKNITMVKYCNN